MVLFSGPKITRQQLRLYLPLGMIIAALVVAKVVWPMYLQAQTAPQQGAATTTGSSSDSSGVGADIDEFFGKGAQGYLLWQFGGAPGSSFETDQYTFYKGDPVCDVLKEKAAQYGGDHFLGVNIHSAPKFPGNLTPDLLSYLANDCGTKVIRVFGTEPYGGIPAVQAVLAQVNAYNAGAGDKKIQVIVAAADYSNVIYQANSGDIPGWFRSKYLSDGYFKYVTSLAIAIGKDPALFGIELANEPHCAGESECYTPYINWAHSVSAAVKQSVTGNVGLGQLAHGDLAYYAESNHGGGITMASGHYYDDEQKANNLKAMESLGGKPFFYIGEAPPNVSKKQKKNPFYEFNIQREQSPNVLHNFYDEYSVACMPKQAYSVGFENTEKCGKAGVFCPADWQSWNVPGEFKLTADGKFFGLFRDQKKVTARVNSNSPNTRLESIEGYLGTVSPLGPSSRATAVSPLSPINPDEVSTKQSPLYSLTTLEQQCELVVKKLQAVQYLCQPKNRVELYTTAGKVSPDTSDNELACGLDTDIPGTSYNQSSMLKAFSGKNKSCNALANSTNDDDRKFLTDLLKVNTSLETAYRPAFIVAVTTFDPPAATSPNATLHPKDEPPVSGAFNVVDYLEVKVPATASDFLPPDSAQKSSGDDQMNKDRNNYRDPLLATADLLQSYDALNNEKQKEETDRQQMRAYGDIKPAGSIIGQGLPVFCNINGKLVLDCKTKEGTGTSYQDQIPAALSTFINASGLIAPHDGWDSLPCSAADEVQIYGPKNTEKIAEQAKTIVAELQAQNIGPYEKKKDITATMSARVVDSQIDHTIKTTTTLYYVGPHRYGLQHIQNGFLSFLSLEQLDASQNGKSTALANLTNVGKSVLDPSKFSPLLKSELGKSINGEQKKQAYEITSSDALPPPGQPTIPGIRPFDLVGKFQDKSDNPNSEGIFWKVAGQVASLPTRMMAMVTTPFISKVNQDTQKCTGNYATEQWLKDGCASLSSLDTTKPENACKVDETHVTSSDAGGNNATISDGLIALALNASKFTCTPAEILIGVLAKESSGSTYVPSSPLAQNLSGASQTPLTGDPNEKVYRQFWSLDYFQPLNENGVPPRTNSSLPAYYYGSGAYQYSQFGIAGDSKKVAGENHKGQVGTYGGAINPCLSGLSVNLSSGSKTLSAGDLDTRKVGVSMCVAGANLWRGIGGSCNGTAADFNSLSQGQITAAVVGFHGADNATGNYLAAINAFKDQVAKVRAQLASCQK